MLRIGFATVAGLLGLLAYIVAAVTLFDRVQLFPQPIQFLYFLAAGVLWVIPARSLMYWAAR